MPARAGTRFVEPCGFEDGGKAINGGRKAGEDVVTRRNAALGPRVGIRRSRRVRESLAALKGVAVSSGYHRVDGVGVRRARLTRRNVRGGPAEVGTAGTVRTGVPVEQANRVRSTVEWSHAAQGGRTPIVVTPASSHLSQ